MPTALPGATLRRLRELAQTHRVQRLELLGSAARGEVAPHDFVVTFQPTPPLAHGRISLGLAGALEDELGAAVDLLESISNPVFSFVWLSDGVGELPG